jgi:hypothetical protein
VRFVSRLNFLANKQSAKQKRGWFCLKGSTGFHMEGERDTRIDAEAQGLKLAFCGLASGVLNSGTCADLRLALFQNNRTFVHQYQ